MARKVAELEAAANQLGGDFFRLMPQMYQDRASTEPSLGPIGDAWRDAWEGVSNAYVTLKALSTLLQEKAEGSPLSQCPYDGGPKFDIGSVDSLPTS